jgi:hypothetical protein
MAHHQPIVIDRIDWRITKAECSCGANLDLGRDSGSPKEQAERLGAAFQEHKRVKKEAGRKNPAASTKLTLIKKPKREDFSQAVAPSTP